MKKKQLIVILSCLFIIPAGVLYSCSYGEKDSLITSLENGQNDDGKSVYEPDEVITQDESDADNDSYDQADSGSGLIYVHICGAVANPDVYRIEEGSRLIDLIEAAGGLSADAAGDYINQAMEVMDGQRIYIPTREEVKALTLSEYIEGDSKNKQFKEEKSDSRVNINTADETELMSLPGIGQAKAKSIIEYRNKNGKFSDISDIMNIPGIKEGLFNKISDYITVGN